MLDRPTVTELSNATLEDKAKSFHANSIVDISGIFSEGLHKQMKREAENLIAENGKQREFRMDATDQTPRRMKNVEQKYIAEQNGVIASLYDDKRLHELVSNIVRDNVYSCPYEPERMVITQLDEKGATHGWHWDDYSLALVWILDAPPPETGGILQCVPNTFWDKEKPDVLRFFLKNPIYSYHFGPGQAYLMQTSRTMHRVYPLLDNEHRRLIVNFAFATEEDMRSDISHETVEALWEPT